MPSISLKAALAATLSSVLTTFLAAQTAPIGQNHPNAQPLANVQVQAVAPLDRVGLAQEDEQLAAGGMPMRVALPTQVQITPNSHGTWEQLDATWSLWRLRIQCPGANFVALGFPKLELPKDARMQLYSKDYTDVLRPFTARDVTPDQIFSTPIVKGDEIVCEIYLPTAQQGKLQASLTTISSGYRGFGFGASALPADGSGSCNVDVVCPQGAGWQTEIDGCAHIFINSTWICSGAMINNTAQDQRNLFLTAHHCVDQVLANPSLVYYWNYQNTTCGGGGASTSQFTFGSTLRATWSVSDFALFETNTPPAAYGVEYLGWDRSSGGSTSSTCIHHPDGDAKKISHDYNNLAVYTNVVEVNNWEVGVTEGGSSGSPLFNQDKHIIGQLWYGSSSCANPNGTDGYGRFFRSWTGGGTPSTRLSDWLDPGNTGAVTLDAYGTGTVAEANEYGVGCYPGPDTFNELFAAGTFDLAGTASVTNSVVLTPAGGGYDITSGGNNWFTPQGPDLGMADDGYSLQILPFSFAHPGGSTVVVRFSSNGFVWLNATSSGPQWDPILSAFTSEGPRLAPLWVDLDPTSGGTCHYDDQGSVVYFTWLDVPAYNAPGTGNSMQVAIYSNGTVEYRYRNFANQPDDAIIGYTVGSTSAQAAVDVSASMPFDIGKAGLTWEATNRPIIGLTQVLKIGNIPDPLLSIPLVIAGFNPIPSGFDLGLIGAGGCNLYMSADVVEVIALSGFWFFGIPNDPNLLGSHVYTQGAALVHPSVSPNVGGIITSNAIDLLIGNN